MKNNYIKPVVSESELETEGLILSASDSEPIKVKSVTVEKYVNGYANEGEYLDILFD